MSREKLSWTWSNRDDQIIVSKSRGKLTIDEIVKFLTGRDQILAFGEGTLAVIAFRLKSDTYQGLDFEEPAGDTQGVWILGDESRCFCGRILHTSWCPRCGASLTGEDGAPERIRIDAVAEYLTQHLIIPPGGTVPAAPETKKAEWIRILNELNDGGEA